MKRIRIALTALILVAVFCINVKTLNADEYQIHVPWSPDLPAVGRLMKCQQNLGGGWSRGSVKWECTVQLVCPLCRCTPEACGYVSIGH